MLYNIKYIQLRKEDRMSVPNQQNAKQRANFLLMYLINRIPESQAVSIYLTKNCLLCTLAKMVFFNLQLNKTINQTGWYLKSSCQQIYKCFRPSSLHTFMLLTELLFQSSFGCFRHYREKKTLSKLTCVASMLAVFSLATKD